MNSIYEINSYLFCYNTRWNYDIKFYDTEYYKYIGVISYETRINYFGKINEQTVVFKDYDSSRLVIIDIKFLEIVQIINIDYDMDKSIFYNNCIMAFYIFNDEIKIIKNKYSLTEKCFLDKEIIKRKTTFKDSPNILATNKGYIILCSDNNIEFVS